MNIQLINTTMSMNGKAITTTTMLDVDIQTQNNDYSQYCIGRTRVLRDYIKKNIYNPNIGCGELRDVSCLLRCPDSRNCISPDIKDSVIFLAETLKEDTLVLVRVPKHIAWRSSFERHENTIARISEKYLKPIFNTIGY